MRRSINKVPPWVVLATGLLWFLWAKFYSPSMMLEERWLQFKEDHHCARSDAAARPAETPYLCDSSERFTRS